MIESLTKSTSPRTFGVDRLPDAEGRGHTHAGELNWTDLHSSVNESVDLRPDGPPVADQQLHMLQLVAKRLCARYPTASPTTIRNSVEAAHRLFRDARVQQFLPILIEREASDILRTVIIPSAG